MQALTSIPTAPGGEHQVVDWVERWAVRRGLRVKRDDAGNLVLSTVGRSRRRPVVAVAHLDHPALVVKAINEKSAVAELRGGVLPPYLEGAAVESSGRTARVASYSPETAEAVVTWHGTVPLRPGDVLRWKFSASVLGVKDGRLRAPACDDLAGVAGALAALDVAQARELANFSVLLTRAEEVGFVGAMAACELGTVHPDARVLSIECSRASADAPLGAGPIVRVGDASSVFTADLTNRVTEIVRRRKIPHQRKLMSGGSCEATAFVALGWEATGLCLALDNYHNMMDIDGVLAGRRRARLAPEVISIADFHGLVDLLVAAAADLNSSRSDLPNRLRDIYAQERSVLD